MNILVTGGAGYIGSHMTLLLLQAGHDVVVLDNLSNASADVLQRVARLAGCSAGFVRGDLRDAEGLAALFARHAFDAVLHFAGLKAVGESVARPLEYYDNNVLGTLRLLQAMDAAGVRKLVFSSSATVYGNPARQPVTEDFPLSATNPYAACKLHCERMLLDLQAARPEWRVAILRYFNPVGAHPGGQLGELPRGTPNNLMPYIAQVAAGQREFLQVYGNDYETPDGTGVRDYIHVMDLVEGHLKALDALDRHVQLICNLGTGQGHSVLEMIHAFERACGVSVPYRIVPRRSGDVACAYACTRRARLLLGWEAGRDVQQMCRDAWAFQQFIRQVGNP